LGGGLGDRGRNPPPRCFRGTPSSRPTPKTAWATHVGSHSASLVTATSEVVQWMRCRMVYGERGEGGGRPIPPQTIPAQGGARGTTTPSAGGGW